MILDVATASIATGIPERTIQRWVNSGWLTDHSPGERRITVDVDAVVELAEKRPHGRLLEPPRTVA